MDKTVAGVLTTVTMIALSQAQAQAAPAAPPTMETAMQASSYADLLTPIPNALALLQAQPAKAESVPGVIRVDDQSEYHHRRRRHHHRPPPPPPHHHHHDQTI